jgi:ribulose-5-phosphate 4-epimerase/fuculose-1-phosphate aldolase
MNAEQDLKIISNHVAQRIDLIQGAGGNTSVKLHDGTMVVKASGRLLKEVDSDNAYTTVHVNTIVQALQNDNFDVTNPQDIVVLGNVVKAARVNAVDVLQPSMETSFHCLYDQYVLHTHNVYANIFMCSSHFDLLETCFTGHEEYTISSLQDYYTPGTELSWFIYDTYRFSEAMPNVTFLPNHGVIYSHNNIDELKRIHDDVQHKIMTRLELKKESYPTFMIAEGGIQCNFLFIIWKKIEWQKITTDLLFPDQAIYINTDTISDTNESAKIFLNFSDRVIKFNCSQREADGIIETMIAYFFILNQIQLKGYEPLTINYDFDKLRNMSSEQYRKQQIK